MIERIHSESKIPPPDTAHQALRIAVFEAAKGTSAYELVMKSIKESPTVTHLQPAHLNISDDYIIFGRPH